MVSEDAQNARQIITLSQDSFYRDLTSKESEQAKKGMFNFDHPGKHNLKIDQHSVWKFLKNSHLGERR